MKIEKIHPLGIIVWQLLASLVMPDSDRPDGLFYLTLTPKIDLYIAKSVDPDQMLHDAASDLGLHSLPYIQQCFRHIKR